MAGAEVVCILAVYGVRVRKQPWQSLPQEDFYQRQNLKA